MGIPPSVVANDDVPPCAVGGPCSEDDIGVVELCVVADPSADEHPCGTDSRVSTKACDLLRFSSYKSQSFLSLNVPSCGLHQRCLGASLAVKGVYAFSTRLDTR